MDTETTPFYRDAAVTLYCGDAFEVLPRLERDSVHLVVADPPYGVRYQSGRRQQKLDVIAGDDGSFDLPGLLKLACGPLRRGRHVYVFREAGGQPNFGDAPLTEPGEVVWSKETVGTGDLQSAFGTSHELIAFSTYEPSKANRDKGYGRLAARMRKQSVIRCPRVTSGGSRRLHPNEKPVPLLRELIESSSCIGETVLDPCAGVGSTLVAAVLEGRRAIGIEIDEANCETAARRLRATAAAMKGLADAA